MSDGTQVGNGDWAMMVKQAVNEKPLAEAGYELARIVTFALKTQHDAQFARDVDACVKSFWARCEREKDATPSPVGASVPSDIAETIKESIDYAKKSVSVLGRRSLTQSQIELATLHLDAALTWLAQQRGQG